MSEADTQPRPTVLITGVAGFIGSNLADRLLSEGYTVVGLDNLEYGVEEQIPDGVTLHRGDIRSKEIYALFEGVDTVFHLAAKNCISDCQDDPVETADINVTGTVNVFEACRRAGVRKTIYAESAAVYEGIETMPTPEHEVAPQSFYGVSKLASMEFAKAYERFHGMKMTALRYFGVYGPRQDYRRSIPPVMSAFIIKLLRGERPTIYGSGAKKRDFIYVDDVNDFHLLAMKDDRPNGQVYNLGYGRPYSVGELFDEIEAILQTGITPEHKPDLPGEALVTHADITAARSLGWEPKVSLEEGLRRSIEYIRKHVIEAQA
ncbi:MAG: NAD-dependent epimerase/dehydratase family protein [Candidatus Poribacteria bacterium]|nr:NAD-dependent epimerase/dehydratase family protein [Candidatus Poribacteria bacterium]